MAARLKARQDQSIEIAWHSAVFPRQRRLKELEEYLRPPLPVNLKREKEAYEVRRMFERMINRQKEEKKQNGSQ